MPRPNTGPRLVVVDQQGWTTGKFYISVTEGGRNRRIATGVPAADPDEAQAKLAEFLRETARARRNGPGNPDQVKVADVIQDYVVEHGANVPAPDTLTQAARPLAYFFADDTVAT